MKKKAKQKLSINILFISAVILLSTVTSVYGATGDTASGAFANNGDSGTATLGTYNAATSGDGILSATTGGKLTVTTDHVSVTNTGNPNAKGIYANGLGSLITLSNATVKTTTGTWNAYNDALCAVDGGKIIAEDLDLATAGSHSAGIRADGPGSSVTAHDIVFTGTGNAATGIWTVGGGQVTVGDVYMTIITSGATYDYGLVSDGATSLIEATGGTISITDKGGGSSNNAVRAINGGTINVTGLLIIDTDSIYSKGVYSSNGGVANLSDITITTKGPVSDGFLVGKVEAATGMGSGIVHVDGAIDVSVSGMNSVALTLQAPMQASYSEFTTTERSTTKLRASSGAVISYQGGANSTATIYNADIATTDPDGSNAVISVGRNFNNQATTDPALLAAAPTTNAVLNIYNGTVTAGANGPLVDVANASSFTLNADEVILTGIATRDATSILDMNLNNGSIWNVTGNYTLSVLRNDNSLINFVPPANPANQADYKTIRTAELSGQDGAIVMNTNLAANIGDLIITGSTSGNTIIYVRDPGGAITGNPQQLEVIRVTDANQHSGTFTLGNPNGVVDVGNYKFHLETGETLKRAEVWSWFLAAFGMSDQTQTIISAADQAGTWIMQNDSLLRRMGELRTTDYSLAAHGMQSWVRGYGWEGRVNTSNNGANYKSTVWGVDAGADKTWQTADGRLSTGAFIGMSNDKRDVGDNNAGSNDINTIYGGFYGTWMASGGFYIDAVAKAGYLNTDLNDTNQASKGSTNNWGILGSVEIGQQFKGASGWFIEPQIHGTYVHFTSAGYTMAGSGSAVDQSSSDSYDLRGGVVAGKSISTEQRGMLQPYVRAMAGQTWTSGGEVKINGDIFDSNSAGSRYEVGGGLIWQISGQHQLYADYGYIKGPRIEVPWRVNLGYRVAW